jgi:hypothetical protein
MYNQAEFILAESLPFQEMQDVAKGHKSEPRKRRTREHVIAELSVNHVERLILRCGWAMQRMAADYGVDLLMETFTAEGAIENGRISFQLKATDGLKVLGRRQVIPVRLEWRDVVFWLNEALPGILVIYDAVQDRAWWLHLQAHVRSEKQQRRPPAWLTLHVPLANVLDEAAIRHFAQLRDAALAKTKEDRS